MGLCPLCILCTQQSTTKPVDITKVTLASSIGNELQRASSTCCAQDLAIANPAETFHKNFNKKMYKVLYFTTSTFSVSGTLEHLESLDISKKILSIVNSTCSNEE